MADLARSNTQRLNDRLSGLARQIVNIPGPGARWDWNKILPADRFEVAYEALLVAIEELGIEAENGDCSTGRGPCCRTRRGTGASSIKAGR